MLATYDIHSPYIAGVNMRDLDLLVGFIWTLKRSSIFVLCHSSHPHSQWIMSSWHNEYKLFRRFYFSVHTSSLSTSPDNHLVVLWKLIYDDSNKSLTICKIYCLVYPARTHAITWKLFLLLVRCKVRLFSIIMFSSLPFSVASTICSRQLR